MSHHSCVNSKHFIARPAAQESGAMAPGIVADAPSRVVATGRSQPVLGVGSCTR
jgi:hypothetical protein